MRRSSLPRLRCPACKQKLKPEVHGKRSGEIIDGRLTCQCGRSYSVHNGIPDLIYPSDLLPSDDICRRSYREMAKGYDIYMEWLFRVFGEDENAVRSQMVELLEVASGSCVLEVGCGTGADAIFISQRLASKGKLYLQDISPEMLEIARRKLAGSQTPVEYFLSNASYLPFADGVFDAAFHFGGLNTFGDKARALAEITRVVRIGGKIVVGDEGVPPWLRKRIFGRVLVKYNPLYKCRAPLTYLPGNARNVCLRWILGNAFYLLDYRVGEGPPELNIDLPVPFKGDTIRSRYYGSKTNR